MRGLAPQLKFDRTMLAPAPVELITYRLLSNLRRVYLGREDPERRNENRPRNTWSRGRWPCQAVLEGYVLT